jgi:hypothetical protein
MLPEKLPIKSKERYEKHKMIGYYAVMCNAVK